jgi:hypothetical protein
MVMARDPTPGRIHRASVSALFRRGDRAGTKAADS